MYLKYAVLTLLIATTGVAGPAAAENLQGFAKGYISRYIDPPESGIALLQSFYFNYSGTDHHLQAIGINSNWPSINRVRIGFQDKNPDDKYFYNITFERYSGQIFSGSYGQELCVGSCTKTIQSPTDRQNYVFVIRGFNVFYHGDDHHMDQIGIRENNGRVTVSFNDKNNDDTFLWDLQYAYIPRTRITDFGARSGNAKGGQRVSIRSGAAAIRGFNFNFSRDDHHIKDIGIQMTGNGQLTVFYGDKNQDDLFSWQVQYAIL